MFEKVTRFMGNSKLYITEHSPEILVGVGVVSVVAGVVLACRATLKVDAKIEQHKQDLDKIATTVENTGIDYSETEADNDRNVVAARVVKDCVVEYAPAAGCVVLGITCFLVANHILKGRNVALIGAYTALQTAYDNYRKRVIDKEGKDADEYYMYGIEKEMIEVEHTNEDGTTEKVLEERKVVKADDNGEYLLGSPYARIFDAAHSTEYDRHDPHNDSNMSLLKIRENRWNGVLQRRGHVFLNEVLNDLGFPICPEGQKAGWVLVDGVSPEGDGYIDFGINNCYTRPELDGLKDEGGFKPLIVLDFNVDGNILPYIGTGKVNELTEEDRLTLYAMQNK